MTAINFVLVGMFGVALVASVARFAGLRTAMAPAGAQGISLDMSGYEARQARTSFGGDHESAEDEGSEPAWASFPRAL